jgi:hypothetical protein
MGHTKLHRVAQGIVKLYYNYGTGVTQGSAVGWANIRHILFIRIMNNFGLLFEYSNNIRIFILLNKLPILAKISKKIKNS